MPYPTVEPAAKRKGSSPAATPPPDLAAYDPVVDASIRRRRDMLAKRQDAGEGFLRRAQVLPRTLIRYEKLVEDFATWAGVPSLHRFKPPSDSVLDALAAHFLGLVCRRLR